MKGPAGKRCIEEELCSVFFNGVWSWVLRSGRRKELMPITSAKISMAGFCSLLSFLLK